MPEIVVLEVTLRLTATGAFQDDDKIREDLTLILKRLERIKLNKESKGLARHEVEQVLANASRKLGYPIEYEVVGNDGYLIDKDRLNP